MREIILLDTSVYLNLLDIPGRNQQREQIMEIFAEYIERGHHFLLPMATIWETGNHISRLANGDLRYQFALRLSQDVQGALEGIAPYRPTYFPNEQVFGQWVSEFPEFSKLNKSPQKKSEGVSLSDLSIIKEWEHARRLNRHRRVRVWSLDSDLAGYDTGLP